MISGLGASDGVRDGVGAVAEAVPVSIVAAGICVVGNSVIVPGVSIMVGSVASEEVAVVGGGNSVV